MVGGPSMVSGIRPFYLRSAIVGSGQGCPSFEEKKICQAPPASSQKLAGFFCFELLVEVCDLRRSLALFLL